MRMIVAMALAIFSTGICRGADEAADVEVHIVGVWPDVPNDQPITIKVDRPGKRVILALGAQRNAAWRILEAPDTKVEKIIVTGYRNYLAQARQTFVEKPKHAEIEDAYYEPYFVPVQPPLPADIEQRDFRRALRALHRRTGIDPTSFHGVQEPGAEVIIKSGESDHRLAYEYPQPTAEKLADLRFHALHVLGDRCSYGEFTLKGPLEPTLVPLSASVDEIAFAPELNQYFGVGDHEISRIDVRERKATKLDEKAGAPHLTWPNALAYDTKRKRLVVGDWRELFAYDPEANKWKRWALHDSTMAIASMVYSPSDDTFYAVGTKEDRERRKIANFLQVRAPDGTVWHEFAMGEPMFAGAIVFPVGQTGTQLKMVGDQLVLLTTPPIFSGDEAGQRFIFLIDPKTGKSVLASRY
jgi:hypothetical protein